MPELGSHGSVRGARGNSRPYRESNRTTVKTALMTLNGRPAASLSSSPAVSGVVEVSHSVIVL